MMAKKEMKTDVPYGARTLPEVKSEAGKAFAARLLAPQGKNPYHKGNVQIRNLEELARSLTLFEASEAGWVADWLEYLGDPVTADRIRRRPADLKRIVSERYDEMKRLA